MNSIANERGISRTQSTMPLNRVQTPHNERSRYVHHQSPGGSLVVHHAEFAAVVAAATRQPCQPDKHGSLTGRGERLRQRRDVGKARRLFRIFHRLYFVAGSCDPAAGAADTGDHRKGTASSARDIPVAGAVSDADRYVTVDA